jgi:hypothetical protein
MFLRESRRATDTDINLDALMNPDLDIGVPGGAELLAFAAAIIGNDSKALDAARLAVAEAIGPQAVPAASAIAANFSKNDRIANGCGIPFDPIMLKATTDIRAQLGLNEFRSAVNTFKHFPGDR